MGISELLELKMPATETGKVIPITEASLARMPKAMAKRLKLGMREEVPPEFDEWVKDMGYHSFSASPMLRQIMFEAFIGGWGAKVRQLKRKKKGADAK